MIPVKPCFRPFQHANPAYIIILNYSILFYFIWSLIGVVGRKDGSMPGYAYSDALKDKAEQNYLIAFLGNLGQ